VPSALSYVGTTALTFGIAYELAGAAVAPLAVLVYATSVGAFLFGRFVFTDSLLVFATTLALYVFEDRSFAKLLRPVLGASVAAAVFLPWHVAMSLRDPSFLEFYVINEHLRRFLPHA
jgi:4-amino-4-deoxy-L-arabinose transferase-like glycosyltransferase